MRVGIVGAGVAGLGSALMLARAGHNVTLLERDATPLPNTPDEAFAWVRRGAPQVRHSHAFLARGRNVLRDRLPDVRQALLDAGATEVGWADMVPETVEDRSPQPGDEDLVMLACRRTTFEWVLRHVAEETVDVRHGVTVEGVASTNGSGPPRITGVRTSQGDLDVDLVLDATGRPSRLPKMLADHGVRIPEKKRPVGIVYLSRFYRIRQDCTEPAPQAFIGADLEYLKFGVMRGDNHTFSVTFAYATDDKDMRMLREPGRFDAACHLFPAITPWIEASDPISKVHYMGGLTNRFRPLVSEDGPVVLGLLAVGDSSVCTNPLYGRGCSLALVHAALATDAIGEHGNDLPQLVRTFDEDTRRELIPWFDASAAADKVNIQVARGEQLSDFDAYIRSLAMHGIFPAASVDADVSRTWVRGFNLLVPPYTLLSDPDVMRKVLAVYEARETREPPPSMGPKREAFFQALNGGT
jgi:2-polyprenyl-6-methoxyphenol hydroxylase-like FAD-dependent oxidoreductase